MTNTMILNLSSVVCSYSADEEISSYRNSRIYTDVSQVVSSLEVYKPEYFICIFCLIILSMIPASLLNSAFMGPVFVCSTLNTSVCHKLRY